jgi:hypothetical protein
MRPILIRIHAVLLLALCSLPGLVQATEYEIARLTTQIQFHSDQLASAMRYSQGYGRVGLHADRLSREAEQLLKAIRRNRSDAYIRSEFGDLSQRYQDLEEAFFRAQERRQNQRLFNQLGNISKLYTALSTQFYYRGNVEPAPRVYYYEQAQPIRLWPPSAYRSRALNLPGPTPQNKELRRDRRDYGRLTATRPLQFDHRSSVLERQAQRQSQYQHQRSYIERASRSRERHTTETRRRNHFD